MTNRFELLAPGGDIESIKAAIIAGADAIYCGLDKFNARNRATNITLEDLNGIIRLAHKYNCKIFLTLNIIILESEFQSLLRLLNKLVNTKIDGIILQDLGLFYLLKEHFKSLDVHASTQTNTHNEGQILFLGKLNASRVNLSRELNIKEIKHLAQVGKDHNVLMEVFVHGSYCIGFSGLCYISSVNNGNSGNRGRCSQPCRDEYKTTAAGKSYPLNLKDNSAYSDLKELADAGVYSLKIEGRIKKFHYVYTVVDNWRKQIQSYCDTNELLKDDTELRTVFNRDFTNSYLKGKINKDMFIDNPRDNTVTHFSNIYKCETASEISLIKKKLYNTKTDIITTVTEKIKDLDISILPLHINISGTLGEALVARVITPEHAFEVQSESMLIEADKHTLDFESIEKRLRQLNTEEYFIKELNINNLSHHLFISFKEISNIKDKIAYLLNGEKHLISPVEISSLKPVLDTQTKKQEQNETKDIKTKLSVLISSKKDINLTHHTSTDIYFQLPEGIQADYSNLIDVFSTKENLIPWFPAILIGDNYDAAIKFLDVIKPKSIVTNNTGIAYKAYEMGISWIAGPFLNTTNSLSLQCMKNEFNCAGAFISNEINKNQIKNITKPDNFTLHYSIYHPILLMTSRQCLFHQTTGCKKEVFDDNCIKKCTKSASIINMKDLSFVIDKQKGEYNNIYSEHNYLNMEIHTDIPDKFTSLFIDLRNIKTDTQINTDKESIIIHFERLLNGDMNAKKEINSLIFPTTHQQYIKGL